MIPCLDRYKLTNLLGFEGSTAFDPICQHKVEPCYLSVVILTQFIHPTPIMHNWVWEIMPTSLACRSRKACWDHAGVRSHRIEAWQMYYHSKLHVRWLQSSILWNTRNSNNVQTCTLSSQDVNKWSSKKFSTTIYKFLQLSTSTNLHKSTVKLGELDPEIYPLRTHQLVNCVLDFCNVLSGLAVCIGRDFPSTEPGCGGYLRSMSIRCTRHRIVLT